MDAAIPLTRESYKRKFTALLYLEEAVHDKLLKEKCSGVYQLHVKPRERAPHNFRQSRNDYARYAHIHGMTGDHIMYAAQASECVFIYDPAAGSNQHVARADILPGGNFHSLSEKLFIGFNHSEASKLESYFQMQDGGKQLPVSANFEVKHSYFKLLRRSIDKLSDDSIERIMPQGGDFVEGLNLTRVPNPKEYDALELDKKQFRALQLILFSRSRAPVIIPGPFGTGKTRVLAVATYNFIETAKKSNSIARVLLCCQQQVSADTFVESYFGKISTDKWGVKVVRLTRDNNYRREKFDVPFIEFKQHVDRYKKLRLLVMVTTFSSALKLVDFLGDEFFTHILLDEGAQAREPEAVAPLCMANSNTKIVIAGDPQQVGPAILVLGDQLQEYGLGVSLLERLLVAYSNAGGCKADYIAHLTTNYRCHKDILELPSELFYGSSLYPMSSALTVPGTPYPLLFVCSSVADPKPTEEDTYEYEAQLLMEQFRQFCRKGNSHDFKQGTCFMALSRRQVTVMKNLLSKHEKTLVKLFPSYEIQGREFKALFISTMECVKDGFQSANPTKSFCSRYVFNTALTRAKSLVVCAGNPFQLLKVEAAMPDYVGCWREYIKRCLENGTFVVPARVGNRDHVIEQLTQKDLAFTSIQVSSCNIPQIEDRIIDPAAVQREETLRAPQLTRATSLNQKTEPAIAKREEKLSSTSQMEDKVAAATEEIMERLKAPNFKKEKIVPSSQPPAPTGAANTRLTSGSSGLSVIPTIPSTKPWSAPVTSGASSQALSSKQTTLPPLQSTINQRQNPTTLPASSSSSKTTAKSQAGTSPQPVSKPTTRPKVAHHPSLQPSLESIKPAPQMYLSESEYPSLGESLKQAPPTRKNQVPREAKLPPPQPPAVRNQPVQSRPAHQEQAMPFRQISRRRLNHVHQQKDVALLDAPLTQDNYKDKFHQLLCREEEEHEKILHEKCDGEYKLIISQNGTPFPGFIKGEEPTGRVRYGYISAHHLNGDTIAYAEQSGEGKLLISCRGREVSATTIRVSFELKKEERIYVWISEADATKLPGFDKYHKFDVTLVNVTFELKWSYFHRLHKALDLLSSTTIKCLVPSCIPPMKENNRKVGIWDNLPPIFKEKLHLDSQQTNALKVIVNATPDVPAIVVGSFGTGKTRLLARAAFEFLKYRRHQPRPRVLVCAHHQPSADSFLTNYFGPLVYSDWEVQNIARMIIKESDRHDYKPETYPELCFTAHEVDFKNVQLVITTFGNVLHLQGKVFPGYFTHILIDEGAQTREPENIIPLWLCEPKTVVAIAGDHKQVGPSILVLGEEARGCGLKVSLLERLHGLYNSRERNASHLCATLLTNHRCHPALLALPSYLFYESALINSDSQDQPKLHPSTSFPLHFICSSLHTKLEVDDDTNPYEADLLLAEAAKYVKKWPSDWDDRYSQPVCIMATTANQQSVIRDKLRTKDYKHVLKRDTVESLTVFTMQGCQFQCLFLSTSEPTYADGASKNPTKTPCSQYVFNTALTRAKSLVVCAGNPFLLMATEKKTNNKDKRPFWAEYIRQCWQNDTFKTPDSLKLTSEVRKEKLQKLREMIFTSDNPSYNKKPPADSITEAYRKNYELKLRYTSRGLKWQIKSAEKGDETTEESFDTESTSNKEAFLCNLEIVNRHKALGHPLSSKNPLVTLNGLNNRRCALDGDRVLVVLYPKYEDTDKRYGKVVKVHEKCHQKKYVCRVSRNSTIHFHPTDKKTPTFVTLPKLSQAMLKYSKEDIEAGLESQLKWVVVFEENSLNDKVPKIKTIIPAEVANRLLFVVREVRWHPKYRLPLGAVVESLPEGTNLFHAERLLRATYNTEKDDYDNEMFEKENSEVIEEDLPPHVVRQAFTIDPSDACNLDDALSLVHESDGTYTMAVLISNVGRQLEQGDKYDKRAKERGNSVYGFFRNMIPTWKCQRYSLNPNAVRDVIIVSTRVTLHDDGSVSIHTDSTTIREGKLQSQVRLDYVQAQQFLGKQPYSVSVQQKADQYQCSPGQPNLPQSINFLYRIAVSRRKERLGRAAFACNRSEEDEEDGQESWQAHILVEELMIWANNIIAKHVCNHRPNSAVLRRQAAPESQEMKELKKQYSVVMHLSVALSAHLTSSELQNPQLPQQKLLIPHSTLLELWKAIKSENIIKLQRLLTSDYLYPQLVVAQGQLRRISQRAEYVCSDTPIKDSPSPFRHHSLCLNYYTHFTSPIRRYCDVVIQRLLLFILNPEEYTAEQQEEYSAEKLKEICLHLNVRSREAKNYQREYDQLVSAHKLGESCETTSCYVNRIDGWFAVNFPDVKYQSCLKRESAEFHVSALVCREQDGLLKWNVSMFSFKGNDFMLENTQLNQFKEVKSTKTSVSTKSQVATVDPDSSPIEHSTVSMTVYYPEDCDSLTKLKLCATQTKEAIAVDFSKWHNIIKKVDDLTDSNVEELKATLLKAQSLQEQDSQQPTHDQDRVEKFQKSPIVKYEVACKLGSNSIVSVWLGQTLLREPIISPCLQLIEVAPELRICLQHNKHPAECFSDTQLEQASRKQYESLEEYIKLWKKVFLAEAAENSVITRDKQLTLLKDVPLKWPKLTMPETSTEDYVIPHNREPVMFTIPPESNHFLEYNIKINPGDLVCVRYSVKVGGEECKAVYHLVVRNVYEVEEGKKLMRKKKKGDLPLVIEMENISRNSCQVSSKMANVLKQNPPCELQIINLQESYNRVYKVLISLKDHKMGHSHEQQVKQPELRLVRLIAMGDIEAIKKRSKLPKKELEEWEAILEKDKISHTLWSDVSTGLNEVQMKAIKQALTKKFLLIQGPPGSGKSETGAHIAYIFAQRNHSHQCVVYCAPSNKAVDVVHVKLIEANRQLPENRQLKLLRLYSRTHERMDFPGPHTSDGFMQPPEGEGRCKEDLQDYALHHLIRRKSPKLVSIEDKFKKMQKDKVPSPALLKEYRETIEETEKAVIGNEYHILLATCNECAGGRLSQLRDNGRVAQVIVDECGMAHEPETIAAVSLSNHVVLIGDHKQLQPVIKYNAARENGLSTSLFQRYAEKVQHFLITLKFQYRMHAKICEFPSDYFYGSELKPDKSVEKRSTPPGMIEFWRQNGLCWPIVFCNIIGKEEEASSISIHHRKGRKTDPHSKCNPIEAAKAVDIVKALRKRLKSDQATIAILTPYRAQKDQVLSLMGKNEIAAVVTINESQGDEYDYVILTTVRSLPYNEIRNPDLVQPDKKWLRDNLGFLTDEHQVNVAITRAKQGLIIVGNRTLLEYDKDTWEPLIEFYDKNKCVVRGEKFPR